MLWKDHIGVRGATKAWLEADRQAPLPSYVTPEVRVLSLIFSTLQT